MTNWKNNPTAAAVTVKTMGIDWNLNGEETAKTLEAS